MHKMTERQEREWPLAVARAQSYVDKISGETLPTSHLSGRWGLAWSPEQYPGRGHDLTATYAWGSEFIEVYIDVYGSHSLAVAELTWTHHDSDEDCPCEPCTEFREDEE